MSAANQIMGVPQPLQPHVRRADFVIELRNRNCGVYNASTKACLIKGDLSELWVQCQSKDGAQLQDAHHSGEHREEQKEDPYDQENSALCI